MRSLTEKKKGKQDHQSRNHERTRAYASQKKVLRKRIKRKQQETKKRLHSATNKTEFGTESEQRKMWKQGRENTRVPSRRRRESTTAVRFSESPRESVLTLRNRLCGSRAESFKTGRRYHALLVHVQCASHPILGCKLPRAC